MKSFCIAVRMHPLSYRHQNITKLTNNKKNRDISKIDFHFNIILKLSRQFLYSLHSCNPYLEAQQDI
jgi:hypothetical protein